MASVCIRDLLYVRCFIIYVVEGNLCGRVCFNYYISAPDVHYYASCCSCFLLYMCNKVCVHTVIALKSYIYGVVASMSAAGVHIFD